MKEKSIAELIHDRVVLEGGTLHRWLNGAKFRKVWPEPMIGCRMISSPTEAEDILGFEEFIPSRELKALMRRNADELRRYVADLVAEWRALAPRGSGPSEAVEPGFPIGRGRHLCECHGVSSSGISPAEGSRGGSAAEISPGDGVASDAWRPGRHRAASSRSEQIGRGGTGEDNFGKNKEGQKP